MIIILLLTKFYMENEKHNKETFGLNLKEILEESGKILTILERNLNFSLEKSYNFVLSVKYEKILEVVKILLKLWKKKKIKPCLIFDYKKHSPLTLVPNILTKILT